MLDSLDITGANIDRVVMCAALMNHVIIAELFFDRLLGLSEVALLVVFFLT